MHDTAGPSRDKAYGSYYAERTLKQKGEMRRESKVDVELAYEDMLWSD